MPILKSIVARFYLRIRITDRNAESLYLCGFPAFVFSNGSGLALFVGGVMEDEKRVKVTKLQYYIL